MVVWNNGIDFTSVSTNLFIICWNCSDSVVFFLLTKSMKLYNDSIIKNKIIKITKNTSTK